MAPEPPEDPRPRTEVPGLRQRPPACGPEEPDPPGRSGDQSPPAKAPATPDSHRLGPPPDTPRPPSTSAGSSTGGGSHRRSPRPPQGPGGPCQPPRRSGPGSNPRPPPCQPATDAPARTPHAERALTPRQHRRPQQHPIVRTRPTRQSPQPGAPRLPTPRQGHPAHPGRQPRQPTLRPWNCHRRPHHPSYQQDKREDDSRTKRTEVDCTARRSKHELVQTTSETDNRFWGSERSETVPSERRLEVTVLLSILEVARRALPAAGARRRSLCTMSLTDHR